MRRAVLSAVGIWGASVLASALAVPPADDTLPDQPAHQPAQTDEVPPEFKQAGVCARCHVVSVLEWSISGHTKAETTCQDCHGPSRAHVANERNEVKPDRLPRGAESVAKLCLSCHDAGCPKTLEAANCQECHHVHALIDPSAPQAGNDGRLARVVSRWNEFRKIMADGDKHIAQQDWKSAQGAFRAALKLIPGNHRAAKRLQLCTRRVNPQLPGFEIVGGDFDSESGLPRTTRVAGLDIRMRLVPAGEFDMGSDNYADSRPVHTVDVEEFYLAEHELTQADWQVIMGKNPSVHQGQEFPDAARLPVESVSWDDCQQFLHELNQRVEGGGFRLPTEAEFEYASRCGIPESRLSAASRDLVLDLSSRAWHRGNTLRHADGKKSFLPIEAYAPQPVGTRQPNAWGFCDMQGNISEWCSSLYRPYVYDATDGRESLTEHGLRVVRGGSFADSAESLDPALRHAVRPFRRYRWTGLRLARTVPDTPTEEPVSKSR